jgi:hypothetical protein
MQIKIVIISYKKNLAKLHSPLISNDLKNNEDHLVAD